MADPWAVQSVEPDGAGEWAVASVERVPPKSSQWHAAELKKKSAGPVFDPVKDASRAWKGFTDSVDRSMSSLSQGRPTNPLDNPALTFPSALMQAATNQFTGPLSRALATYGPSAYERPAAPWDERFGQAPRRLEGQAAAEAIEGDLNSALSGIRAAPGALKPLPARVAKPARADVRVAKVVERAQARDQLAGTVPSAAPGAMPIHRGGENLTAMADVVANSPGPGRGIIRQAVRDYEARAVDRTKGDIARDLGGRNDYFATQDSLISARKAAADEGMARLQDQLVTLDNDSVLALRSDLAKGAIRERALNALASPDPAIRADGARLMRLADDLLDKPGAQTITIRDAQDISRSLLEGANSAFASGNGGRGGALKDLGKAIRTNAATPERGGFQEYGDWLKQFGDDMSREEALQLGKDVFGSKQNAEQLRAAVDGMSETERALFQKGVGEALLAKVRGTRGDVGAMRDMLNSEENADRLALAFPDDQAFANFMESAARRVAERDVNSRLTGGSPTDPRMAARADLEDEGFDALGVAKDVFTGDFGRATRKTAKALLDKVPRKSRSVLQDAETNRVLASALTDDDEMTRVLNSLNAARARDARLRASALRALPPLLAGESALSEGQRAGR